MTTCNSSCWPRSSVGETDPNSYASDAAACVILSPAGWTHGDTSRPTWPPWPPGPEAWYPRSSWRRPSRCAAPRPPRPPRPPMTSIWRRAPTSARCWTRPTGCLTPRTRISWRPASASCAPWTAPRRPRSRDRERPNTRTTPRSTCWTGWPGTRARTFWTWTFPRWSRAQAEPSTYTKFYVSIRCCLK